MFNLSEITWESICEINTAFIYLLYNRVFEIMNKSLINVQQMFLEENTNKCYSQEQHFTQEQFQIYELEKKLNYYENYVNYKVHVPGE